MDAVEALTTRASAVKLGEPAPSDHLLATALRAGARAPDHGLLRPWKFLLIRGAARYRLGDVFAEALKRRKPDVSEAVLEREEQKPLRAPLIIVVVAKVQPKHPKIPEIEQVISAGTATQNIMLAFYAQGFGCMWRTGKLAYDPNVKEVLGLEPHDHIVAFLYVGTALAVTPERTRPDHHQFIEVWNEGPAFAVSRNAVPGL